LCLDDDAGQDIIASSQAIVLQKPLTHVGKEQFMKVVDFGLFIPKVCLGKRCSTWVSEYLGTFRDHCYTEMYFFNNFLVSSNSVVRETEILVMLLFTFSESTAGDDLCSFYCVLSS